MCVYSLVLDHYSPRFHDAGNPWPQPLPTYQPLSPISPLSPSVTELAALIAEFKQALEAAKTIDRLTNQPDCEDPDKAKLLIRVADLEKQVEIYKLRELLQSCVDAWDKDEDMTIVTNKVRDYLAVKV